MRLDLDPLLAGVVREEDQATIVERLEQDDPGGRIPVSPHGGQGHRVGLDDIGFLPDVGEPPLELAKRARIYIGFVKAPQ